MIFKILVFINRPASSTSQNHGDVQFLPPIDFQYRFSSQSPTISEEGDYDDITNDNNDEDECESMEPCEIISPSVEGTISSSYLHSHEGMLKNAYESK